MQANDADAVVSILLSEDLARESPRRRLTSAQAARVRSLIIDEGYTRAEALAWVRDFGDSSEWQPVRETVVDEARVTSRFNDAARRFR